MATHEHKYEDVNFETPYEDNYDEKGDINVSPYIPLCKGYGDDAFIGLTNPDEVVIPESEIKIKFHYPLKTELISVFKADTEDGFTRKGLAKVVIKTYEEIYEAEEKTYTESSASRHTSMYGEAHPGVLLLNREETNGTYGIYGHDIEDLLLHRVSYNARAGYWTLGIDS